MHIYLNMTFLIYLLKTIFYIVNEELKLKLNISNIILVLSPINLKIYKIKKIFI